MALWITYFSGQLGKRVSLYLGLSLSIAMETKSLNKKMVEEAMDGLDKIDWDLFSGPWRGLILRQTVNKTLF